MKSPRLQLVVFFSLSFLISWSVWIPLALAGTTTNLANPLSEPIGFLAGFGPILSAIIAAGLSGGRSALTDLFRPLIRWRVGFKRYVTACGLVPLVYLGATAILVLAGTSGVSLLPWWRIVLAFGFVAAVIPVEEVGWRGFALPRLQARYSALVSSLIVGVIWGCWHIPLLFMKQYWITRLMPGSVALSLAAFVLGTVLLSIMMTWVYNSTRGSLLLICLMHASNNSFLRSVEMPDASRALWFVIVLSVDLLLVGALILRYGPANLALEHRHTYPEGSVR
jgi:uncharacterized protein